MRRHISAIAMIMAALLLPLLSACETQGERERFAASLTGGDPQRGRTAIKRYGCSSCHTIPGIPGADSRVGPVLDDIVDQVYVAGVLTNSPGNLIEWIRHPRAIDPKTAMPDMGVTESDARDIAGYLYSLRK